MRLRGFEVISTLKNNPDVQLPKRSTTNAAGYDFFAYNDIEIPSSVVPNFLSVKHSILTGQQSLSIGRFSPTLVHTGIKAYMPPDEFLMLANRSSNPNKLGLVMANSIGVIDSDYYNNPDNEGEILFAFYNVFPVTVKIAKGSRIGQGIFLPFLRADYDVSYDTHERTGGFGSTGI